MLIYWITDEVVVKFMGLAPVFIPRILAYGVIAIDFLELPVMVEIAVRAIKVVLDSGKRERV